jgi:hypothetical protein
MIVEVSCRAKITIRSRRDQVERMGGGGCKEMGGRRWYFLRCFQRPAKPQDANHSKLFLFSLGLVGMEIFMSLPLTVPNNLN